MKIAFFELEGWEENLIKERFPEDELYFSNKAVTSADIPEKTDFDAISVFVDSRIDAEVLKNFPDLKFIATRSTGFDHIDLSACKKGGISVAYVPGYGDNTVAEFAFGLILNLSRKIYQGIDQIKEIGSFSLQGLRGFDLKGKQIGIVGTGRIGKIMIQIAKGFGMSVVAYDVFPDQAYADKMNYKYLSLEELLASSDIISIHTPYMPETHHLINEKNIRLIKKGAILINTARGAIVSTDALVAGLKEGIIGGAGMDVLEEEGETKDELRFLTEGHPREEELKTMMQNHILMKMPNVLITPHNAFNTQEALIRILTTTFEDIEGFKKGSPVNLVPEKVN